MATITAIRFMHILVRGAWIMWVGVVFMPQNWDRMHPQVLAKALFSEENGSGLGISWAIIMLGSSHGVIVGPLLDTAITINISGSLSTFQPFEAT